MTKFSKTALISTLVFLLVTFAGFSLINAADSGEKNEKAWMGIYMQDLNDDIAEALDLEIDEGVLINGVIDDSPADMAGIKDGDVIIRFDNNVIDKSKDLSKAVKSRKPGEKVSIVFFRDGKKQDIELVLGSAETEDRRFSLKSSPKTFQKKYEFKTSSHGYMGVVLQDLGEQLAEYFEVKEGILITQVEEDSPAGKAGLKAGDIITAIDGKKVDSPSHVSKIIRTHEKGDKVEIAYVRKGTDNVKTIEIDEREMNANWFGLNSLDGDKHMMVLPNLEDFQFDHDFDFDFDFDPGDFEVFEHYGEDIREEMEELREELKELQKELRKIQKELN
jgi:S1-C subfamily serine protease